jgi:alanyl-tRNA synthetase
MTLARDVRKQFLDFFRQRGHEVVKSSPLVPHDDPTLLFTNAGMNQFKDVFTGRATLPFSRAASSQKCVRAGGKHNDLENVGRTARHHTFFEMLGNFSFGDYFKEDAIALAWELLTKVWAIDPKRLVITVFGSDPSLPGIAADDEARAIWRRVTGFGDERILGLGKADNFWTMGDTGPQGPCSEIHYFIGDGAADLSSFGKEPLADGTGWVEIWNLVFMQYQKESAASPLLPLPRPSIDTGAGLERVTCVVQGKRSNYETDLFVPLLESAAARAEKKYGASHDDDVSMRVLADHARATAFLLADGVTPASTTKRGSVLRSIMRRAIRHGKLLGLPKLGFRELVGEVCGLMGEDYPELVERRAFIVENTGAEEESFDRLLPRGLKLIAEWKERGEKVMDGATAFELNATHGFPLDLTKVIAEEQGFTVDDKGYERERARHKEVSGDFAGSGEKSVDDALMALPASEFLGYETTTAKGRVRWVAPDGRMIVVDRTPFYGASGGQVGDVGTIAGDGFQFNVSDATRTPNGAVIHHGELTAGTATEGAEVSLTVDAARRDAIRANHSATHLLHWALKSVLGDHVAQKGSLVAPDRLRFDFSHFQPMTEEEKRRVEDIVNDEVRRNQDTVVTETSFDESRKLGAVALFGEKYGDRVRVMKIGQHSVELCGGTHVRRAGDIGLFKIVAEGGIAQGVRRLEAVTGAGALAHVRRLEEELAHAGDALRAPPLEVAARVEKLQKDLRERERKIEDLQRKLAMGGGGGGKDLLGSARDIGGVKVIASRTDIGDPKALRDVADQLRDKLGSGIVILAGVSDGKVALIATVSADLVGRFHAGKLISSLAPLVGGKGGGKPDMAQGGGTRPESLDEALATVDRLLT